MITEPNHASVRGGNSSMSEPALHPAVARLIDALARQAAADYLTAQAAAQCASAAERSDHVPLLPVHKAA